MQQPEVKVLRSMHHLRDLPSHRNLRHLKIHGSLLRFLHAPYAQNRSQDQKAGNQDRLRNQKHDTFFRPKPETWSGSFIQQKNNPSHSTRIQRSSQNPPPGRNACLQAQHARQADQGSTGDKRIYHPYEITKCTFFPTHVSLPGFPGAYACTLFMPLQPFPPPCRKQVPRCRAPSLYYSGVYA